jgi:hypothetical protein
LPEWASSQLGELLLAEVTTHHYTSKCSGGKIRKMTVSSFMYIVVCIHMCISISLALLPRIMVEVMPRRMVR